MAKSIQAHITFVLFDKANASKAAKLRTAMRGVSMVRRNEHGATVVDNKLTRDKGNPPKQPPRTEQPARSNRQ